MDAKKEPNSWKIKELKVLIGLDLIIYRILIQSNHYLSIADSLERVSFWGIILSLGIAYGVLVKNISLLIKEILMNVE